MNLMKKQGKVKKVNGGNATVSMPRSSACGECGECMVPGNGKIEIEADNFISAKEQDIVRVKIEEVNLFFLSTIVYLIPLLFFLLGVFLGYKFFPFLVGTLKYRSLFSVFSGILFIIVGSTFFLKKFNKKRKCNFKIVEIVNSQGRKK